MDTGRTLSGEWGGVSLQGGGRGGLAAGGGVAGAGVGFADVLSYVGWIGR